MHALSRRTLATLSLQTFLLSLLFCFPVASRAQGTSAVVSGFVSDASGAKIPSATVTFLNTDTGLTQMTTTNAAGLYQISGLIPGMYRSTVTVRGFKSTIRDRIDLHLEDKVELNYVLDVGAVSESVVVEGATALIETQSPTVSQVIEGRQVEDTPLNGRNSMNLVALTPGVVAQGATSGAASNNTSGGSFTNANGFNNYSISGGLANQSSVYVDGAPLNILQGHPIAYVITQDAVQEFRVESSVVNPQYGEFGGGIISFATKSGTDKLHGTLYEYLRNTLLNANNFFNNETGQPRPAFVQNQYGATVGGPIPHSKAFFFFSWEGYRLANGVPNLGRVPTPAELSGDFRADPPIFDPRLPHTQFSCNGVANVICANRIDPTANVMGNVVKYFPTPNTSTAGPGINFSQNGKAAASNNEYDIRGDQSLGSKQKLFARYTRLDRLQQATQFLDNPTGPNSGPGIRATAQQYALGDTILLNSTSVLDLRVSYLRYLSVISPQNSNVNLSEFGPFWGAVAPQFTYQQFPNVLITNNISQPFAALDQTQHSPMNNYMLSGAYSKVLGRHSLSFGGEWRQREEYFNQAIDAPGLFVFAGNTTACIPVGGPCRSAAGLPIAPTLPGGGATPISDFLLGAITTAPLGFTEVSFPSAVNHYGGLFANDTFQLSTRLTITAGLRYELPGGFTEKHDGNTVLLPQLPNPLVLVNSTAYASRSDLQTHLTLFSPRVGVAFQPHPGTSFRAGYSLAYLPMDTVYNSGPAGSPVNTPTTFVAPTSYANPPGVPITSLSDPLLLSPHGPRTILQPIGRGYANDPTYFAGEPVTSRIAVSRFPYLQQWNATLQQALGSSTAFQLAYLGARGDHLPIYGTIDINQLPDRYDGLSVQQITAASIAAAPGLPASSNAIGSGLKPYSLYQSVNATSAYVGDTYYHSLQVTFNRHFQSGGTLLANYSWSKFLGNSESTNAPIEIHNQGVIQDYTNLRAEKSYLSFDIPQRLVVSYILDLPVGTGKRFAANENSVVEQVISGWNVSGINSFQSGFPLAIVATPNALGTIYGAGTIRPNVVPGCRKTNAGSIVTQVQHGASLINAACYTAPGPTSFGNAPRTDGSLRDKGVDNWDFSIGKTTPVRDSLNLVFRAEAFNVINRVQFGDPNVTSSSALFGVITTQANAPRSFQFSLRLNY